MCKSLNAYVHIHTRACRCILGYVTWTWVSQVILLQLCMYVCILVRLTCVYSYLCMYKYERMHIYICVCVCVCVCMYVCMYVCIYWCMYEHEKMRVWIKENIACAFEAQKRREKAWACHSYKRIFHALTRAYARDKHKYTSEILKATMKSVHQVSLKDIVSDDGCNSNVRIQLHTPMCMVSNKKKPLLVSKKKQRSGLEYSSRQLTDRNIPDNLWKHTEVACCLPGTVWETAQCHMELVARRCQLIPTKRVRCAKDWFCFFCSLMRDWDKEIPE